MASSWIKVEVITPDKPEIFQIAELLNIDPDAVLGKLVRIWAWADQQTIDGNAGSVTKGVLDRIAFITGFADALIKVGWLAYQDERLVLPNFERHNGDSSKKRALTNRRVAELRKRETQKVTQSALQKALPEEEEEEDIKTPLNPTHNARAKIPVDNFPGEQFAMFRDWKPDPDFADLSAGWGTPVEGVVKKTELTSFIDFWVCEDDKLNQNQWQQKLARHICNVRK
ncbi:hypothetical protein AAF302_000684 [Pluralibacter gergoviae]